jgi:hypothetical protein
MANSHYTEIENQVRSRVKPGSGLRRVGARAPLFFAVRGHFGLDRY